MKDMTFKIFIDTLKKHALEFHEGCEWDNDDWNDAYINFKECVARWSDKYKENYTSQELAIEFALEFYQDANRYTHNYWVVKKDNGWYCARTTKPPYNEGVIVFIPEESGHQTTGMWDESKKWVLLDDYRIPTSEVTAWRPMFENPTHPDFLKYEQTEIKEQGDDRMPKPIKS